MTVELNGYIKNQLSGNLRSSQLEAESFPSLDVTPTPSVLNDLADVNITNPENGQDLIFNEETEMWENTSTISNHIQNTSNPHQVTKTQVGLGNVDNTSDLSKPISTATQSALDLKEDLLPETPENPETKFLNGNKEWKPITIGAGGFAGNLYFTTLDSGVTGYKKISYENETSETELSGTITNQEVLFRTYLYDFGLATDTIDAGVWIANYRAKVSGSMGVSQLRFEAFLRHVDNSETTLFSSYSPELNNTDYLTIRSESNQPAFTCLATDRLGVRIYAKTTANNPITFYTIVGDGNASYFTTPLRIRHNQLRDLNGDEDYQHIDSYDRTNLDNLSGTNTGDQESSDFSLAYLSDVDKTNKATGKIIQVKSDGNHEYVDLPNPDLSGYAQLSGATFTGDVSANNLSGTNTGDNANRTETLTAGENLVSGNVCYLKSDGKYWKAKADAESTTKGRMVLCTESISANATGTFLIKGNFTDSSLTAGATYYLSVSTAGAKVSTIPSTSGNQIRVLGQATSTTNFYFNPSQDYGEVA